MKGDDCPFDHQLSKYPCSNFVSRGFCSKGDNCMFSHKVDFQPCKMIDFNPFHRLILLIMSSLAVPDST